MTQFPVRPGHEIVVSGSISNLGPAFDALSVAVDVYLRVRVDEVDAPGAEGTPLPSLTFTGQVPASGENRIATGFQRAMETFGDTPPGARVHVTTDIPMKAGLGSSSAATVAGLRLYEALTKPRDADALMEIATAIEGHPDNAAAALLGGLTLSCQREDGRILTSAWAWPADLRFVVATPEAELETAFARKVLSPEIPRADAIFNLQRALLLVRALESGRYDHLREALRDRWHQPARARYVPGLQEALAIDHPSVLGVCLSGAGPSIALITTPARHTEAAAQLRQIYGTLGVPCTIRTLSARPPVAS
ncbi:MAG: homoserine kinase [Acidobacteria bacterium]|nr:homoserine kinase [Acidobacteriota bacterium]